MKGKIKKFALGMGVDDVGIVAASGLQKSQISGFADHLTRSQIADCSRL